MTRSAAFITSLLLALAAGSAAGLESELPGKDLTITLSVLPDKPLAKAPAFLSIRDVKFAAGEFAGEIANHVTYQATVEGPGGKTLLDEDWFHSHFDGQVDWIYTFPAAGTYTIRVTPEPTMPGARSQAAFEVEERTFTVDVVDSPANGGLTPDLTLPANAKAGEKQTFEFLLKHPDGSPVIHTDSKVVIQSGEGLFEASKIHTHTGDYALDWTPANGGPHRITVLTTPTGDTPEPFPATIVSKRFDVQGDTPGTGSASTLGGGGVSTPASRQFDGGDYVLPLSWGPAKPVAGQPVRFDVQGIYWKAYSPADDADLPQGLKDNTQTNENGNALVSHVTYIVEITNPRGEREFFSDWFHSHFDGAVGWRYTFAEPGSYQLKIRPEPTMPGMRTQKAFEPETFTLDLSVANAPSATFETGVSTPTGTRAGEAAEFAFSPKHPSGDGAITHTDTRVALTSADFLYVVEKVHSHTGDYAFKAALPDGTYTLTGLTTFTGDTPEGDRFAPTLFKQTFQAQSASDGSPSTPAGNGGSSTPDGSGPSGSADTPAPGALLVVALAGAAALVLGRRGRR